MAADAQLERRLRDASPRVGELTADDIVRRAHRLRRRRPIIAAAVGAAAAVVAGIVVALTVPNGATSVSVGTSSPSVPAITNTSGVTVRLSPTAAAPGAVIAVTLAPTRSVTQLVASDYFVLDRWTGSGWQPLYYVYLATRGMHPSDVHYDPNLSQAGVGYTAGTYRLKVPATLSPGTYRLQLSVSTMAPGADRFHFTHADTSLTVTPDRTSSSASGDAMTPGTLEGTMALSGLADNGGLLDGTVTVTGPSTYTTKVSQGRFRLSVAPGTYAVTGHSPSYGQSHGTCLGRVATVRPGRATTVRVECFEK